MTTQVEPRTEAPPEVLKVVEARFPEREGQRRRIAHLWGAYFRINYHSPERQNYIVESHFVKVEGQDVVERN
jgi:hypothetical protein